MALTLHSPFHLEGGRVALMTAGRGMHDIHTILITAAHWDHLLPPARHYVAHRMRLLYVAITKGWPAALYYDQQGADEFLDVSPEFWASFQPPSKPRAAQRKPLPPRGRSATRRGRGK
jgi:ribonuclease BN (tRNA processing enzyme)